MLALLALAALAACAPPPPDNDPLTPIPTLTPTNPLVVSPKEDPNGGAE